MSEIPLFIADVMLGRLARWLRLIGYDTLYSQGYGDHTLIRLAKLQNRILLTRDGGITQSKACGECIYIVGETIERQLPEVARELKKRSLNRLPQRPRCSLCNGVVMVKERKTLMDELPEHVVLHQAAFFQCQVCGKVYWNGSHSRAISSVRSAFREELRSCCVS